MDEQRAEFEAWAKSKGAPKDGWWIRQIDDGGYSCHAVDMAWDAWQAATQRQQERIAALEAQVQALSVDAGRLDWLLGKGRRMAIDSFGGQYRVVDASCNLVVTDWMPTQREAIDAAIAAGKGEG